jgi:hypothetical protein
MRTSSSVSTSVFAVQSAAQLSAAAYGSHGAKGASVNYIVSMLVARYKR